MKTNLNNKGFTLLELIIVFTVISILSSIGIASFVSYSKAQSLQSAASDLALTLNSAKSRANSQVKPNDCSGALIGYKVVIGYPSTTPITKYSLYAVCGEPLLIKTTTLPDNGKIIFDSDKSIFFPILTGAVGGSGAIVLTGYNLTKTVTIDNVGNISIK
jgi:prepilin-type N-terminal cleavage/methylation domain-containing protein